MSKTRTPNQSFNQLSDLINEIKHCVNLLTNAIECAQNQCVEIKKERDRERIIEEI